MNGTRDGWSSWDLPNIFLYHSLALNGQRTAELQSELSGRMDEINLITVVRLFFINRNPNWKGLFYDSI